MESNLTPKEHKDILNDLDFTKSGRRMVGELNDESIVTFGKYKGKKLGNVPATWLKYMYDMDYLFGSMKDYVRENLDVISEQVKRDWK